MERNVLVGKPLTVNGEPSADCLFMWLDNADQLAHLPIMNAPPTPGWKTKLFGDNRLNFYGWIFAGLFVIGVSLWCVILALRAGATRSPTCLLLLAIYLLLLAILGLTLQNYHSRVACVLDSEGAKKDDTSGA